MGILLRLFHPKASGSDRPDRPISRPLRDSAPSELLAATEAHMLAQMRLAVRSDPQAELHEDPDVTWYVSSIPHPLFNGVPRTRLAANLSTEAIDARIEAVLSPFRARRLPFLWSVTPLTHPADLGASLEVHGLMKAEEEPGMALDLETLRSDVAAPAGLTIDRPRDRAGVRQWVLHMAGSPDEIPSELEPAIAARFASASLGSTSPLRLYLGSLNGAPVATSALFLGGGLAGVYSVATAPEVRRRGIGGALTRAALRDAQKLGYRIAILQSSPMGYGVYRRLGFQEYGTFTTYLWTPG